MCADAVAPKRSQTEPFSQPIAPAFPSIEDSFQIRSTPLELASFLRTFPPLQVYLCAERVFLGVASLPFAPLVQAVRDDGSGSAQFEATRVSGGFPLRRMQSVAVSGPRVSLEMAPPSEEVALAADVVLAQTPAAQSQPQPQVPPPQPATSPPRRQARRPRGSDSSPQRQPATRTSATAQPAGGDTGTAGGVRASQSRPKLGQPNAGAWGLACLWVQCIALTCLFHPNRSTDVFADQRSVDRAVNPKDTTPRHFRFSVELRAAKQLYQPSNVFAKYSYPAFGRTTAVRSRPPVFISRHAERLLPNSFCYYEFAMSRADLMTTLKRAPLMVELWHSERCVCLRVGGCVTRCGWVCLATPFRLIAWWCVCATYVMQCRGG